MKKTVFQQPVPGAEKVGDQCSMTLITTCQLAVIHMQSIHKREMITDWLSAVCQKRLFYPLEQYYSGSYYYV